MLMLKFGFTISDKIVDVTNSTCGTTFTIEPGGEAVMFRYNNQPFADGESSLPGLYRVDCDITVRHLSLIHQSTVWALTWEKI